MSQPTPSRTSAGRAVATVAGAIAAFVAFGLIVAGGVLLYGNSQKDRDGYASTGADRFHTRTYALATDDLDVNTDLPGWLLDDGALGHVRLKATSRDGKPIFVGIAPTKDVDAYLRGTSHTTVTDVEYPDFHATYAPHDGDRPAPPVPQRFWSASANGGGTQTLEWKVRDGNWSVVVMNADGSASVDANVSAGSDVPWLGAAGWTALGGGILFMAIGGALIYAGVRRPRDERAPATLAPAAA
jgi:hypothetical protein